MLLYSSVLMVCGETCFIKKFIKMHQKNRQLLFALFFKSNKKKINIGMCKKYLMNM